MDAETYNKMNFNLAKNRGDVAEKFQCIGFDKYGKQVLVQQGICNCGLKTRAFVTSATMTSKLCIEEYLQKRF